MTDKPDSRNSETDLPIMTEQEKKLYEDSRGSVVNVVAFYSKNGRELGGSAGSGFFVTNAEKSTPEGLILTDNHVVSPQDDSIQTKYEISLDNGKRYPATLVKQDLAHDLAILKIDGVENPKQDCKPLVIADADPAQGEHLLRLNRTRWDSQVKVGDFVGAEKRRDQQIDEERKGEDLDRTLDVFNTYVTIGRNYSGGPYINAAGKVVAIHDAAQGDSKSLATPLKDIRNMLSP